MPATVERFATSETHVIEPRRPADAGMSRELDTEQPIARPAKGKENQIGIIPIQPHQD